MRIILTFLNLIILNPALRVNCLSKTIYILFLKKGLANSSLPCYTKYRSETSSYLGALAQLVARYIRIVEVTGSNPVCSTNKPVRNDWLFSYL